MLFNKNNSGDSNEIIFYFIDPFSFPYDHKWVLRSKGMDFYGIFEC